MLRARARRMGHWQGRECQCAHEPDVHGVHQTSVSIENYKKCFVDVAGKQVADECPDL
jgi:hypothetical protein